MQGGSDDVREGGSGSRGREGKLRKGTSEEGMDGAKEREEASGGRREQRSEGEEKGRSVGGREIGREGNFKGDTLRRTLASTLYSRERTKQHAMRPLPLRLWYYGYCDSSCIV